MSQNDVAVKKEQPKPVAPPVTAEGLVYVSIPLEDNFDFAHPDIIINGMIYKAGETYHLPQTLAATIEDRKHKFRRSQVRLNNPTTDSKSVKEMALHGQAKQGSFVSPASF
jgi:hypothetical protein